jgi:hypothetical protein
MNPNTSPLEREGLRLRTSSLVLLDYGHLNQDFLNYDLSGLGTTFSHIIYKNIILMPNLIQILILILFLTEEEFQIRHIIL